MQCVHKDDKLLLNNLLNETNEHVKVTGILNLYKKYQIDLFAQHQKEIYLQNAFNHLNAVSAEEGRKQILLQTAKDLMDRIN
jgi:hypothetical protein